MKVPAKRRQCSKCPWRRDTDPQRIPGGYDVEKHRRLDCTIARPGELSDDPLVMMACHETPVGAELPCVGWLVHQLGPGNNLALRLRVLLGKVDASVQTVGPQHSCLQDTIPS